MTTTHLWNGSDPSRPPASCPERLRVDLPPPDRTRPQGHRITGEDCFYIKIYLRSIDELSDLLDRFLVYGETTTSLINASPIPRRDPPLDLDGDE